MVVAVVVVAAGMEMETSTNHKPETRAAGQTMVMGAGTVRECC